MTLCDRCQRETIDTRMSDWSQEMLCTECDAVECTHPDYHYAREAEEQAFRNGDNNFPGIGWPGKDGRITLLVQDDDNPDDTGDECTLEDFLGTNDDGMDAQEERTVMTLRVGQHTLIGGGAQPIYRITRTR